MTYNSYIRQYIQQYSVAKVDYRVLAAAPEKDTVLLGIQRQTETYFLPAEYGSVLEYGLEFYLVLDVGCLGLQLVAEDVLDPAHALASSLNSKLRLRLNKIYYQVRINNKNLTKVKENMRKKNIFYPIHFYEKFDLLSRVG